MFKCNVVAKISAKNTDTNDTVEFIYRIVDHNVSARWAKLVDNNNQLDNTIRFNYTRILDKVSIEKQFAEFKANVEYLNANYDRPLTTLTTVDDLQKNINILNDLHEEYEIYGDRLEEFLNNGYFDDPEEHKSYNKVWPGDQHNMLTHNNFLLLNEQIHNFEAIFKTIANPDYALCSCLVDFMPNKPLEEVEPTDYLHEALLPEDYLLFSPDKYWGWLYLGYNTLGKHWSSLLNENDIDVVRRHQVRAQQRFAAECYMYFMDGHNFSTQVRFYKWWKKNNISAITSPDMKLSELALGYIPIAKIYSYKINNGETQIIPNNIDIIDWNKNVWSKFDCITKLEII